MMHKKEALKNYRPKLSDPVKYDTDSDFFKTKEFIYGYIKLGFKYPGTYLNSYLIMLSPILYPFNNSLWREGLFMLTPHVNSINLDNQAYFKHKNKALSSYLSKTQTLVRKNNSMASFVLVNQSFLFYIVVFAFIYFIFIRKYKYCIVLLIPVCYIFTLSLGPVIFFRYTYFLVSILLVIAAILASTQNDKLELI